MVDADFSGNLKGDLNASIVSDTPGSQISITDSEEKCIEGGQTHE